MAKWFTDQVDEYYTEDPEKLDNVLRGNALRLFPRLGRIVSKS